MSAPTIVDTKTCAECCTSFHRPRNASRREFAARRYCSTPCAALGKRDRRAPAQRGLTEPSQSWMADAACRGADEDFVPDARKEAGGALWYCEACPVAAQCLAYGIATRSYGVWGGEWLVPNQSKVNAPIVSRETIQVACGCGTTRETSCPHTDQGRVDNAERFVSELAQTISHSTVSDVATSC